MVEIINKDNLFEKFIANNNPVERYCFSPHIYPLIITGKSILNDAPCNSVYTLDTTGHTYTVVLYKSTSYIIYKFLLNYNDIVEYYL